MRVIKWKNLALGDGDGRARSSGRARCASAGWWVAWIWCGASAWGSDASAACLDVAAPGERPDVLGNVYETVRTSLGDGAMEVMYSVKGDCVTFLETRIHEVSPATAFEAGRVGALQRQFNATDDDMAVLAAALVEMRDHLASARSRSGAIHHASAGKVVNGVCRMWILGVALGRNLSVAFVLAPKSDVERCGG